MHKHTDRNTQADEPALIQPAQPVLMAVSGGVEVFCRTAECDWRDEGGTVTDAAFAHDVHHLFAHAGKARHLARTEYGSEQVAA